MRRRVMAMWAKSGGGSEYSLVDSIYYLPSKTITEGYFSVFNKYTGYDIDTLRKDIRISFSLKVKIDTGAKNNFGVFLPFGNSTSMSSSGYPSVGIKLIGGIQYVCFTAKSILSGTNNRLYLNDGGFHLLECECDGTNNSCYVDGSLGYSELAYSGSGTIGTNSQRSLVFCNGESQGGMYLGDFTINDYHFNPVRMADGRVGFRCQEDGEFLLTDDGDFSAIET